MRKFILSLSTLGAVVSAFSFISALTPSNQPGYRVDAVEVALVFLLAVAFTVSAMVLRRDLKDNPPGGPPLVEPSDPDYDVVMAYERSRKRRQWLIVASPLLVMGGCCGYNVYDTLQTVREAAEFKTCFNNELELDPAIQAFATANRRPPRSVQEVIDAGKLGTLRTVCLQGGPYGLTRNDAGKPVSSCSVHGSLDRQTVRKHPH